MHKLSCAAFAETKAPAALRCGLHPPPEALFTLRKLDAACMARELRAQALLISAAQQNYLTTNFGPEPANIPRNDLQNATPYK